MANMKQKKSSWGSLAIGFMVAALFLFLTFRNTNLTTVWQQIQSVPLGFTLILVVLNLSVLVLRALRWWWVLPRPLRKGEMMAVQRALFVGYGVINLASRLGEVVRVLVLARDTKRDISSIASTVAVDRVLFDFTMFAGLFAYALYAFRDSVLEMFPGLEPAFHLFLAITLAGVFGLLALAFRPRWFQKIFRRVGLGRFPLLAKKVDYLVDRLSAGSSICKQPKVLSLLLGFNLLLWAVPVVAFWVALMPFGIETNIPTLVLLFTISSFGIILPSPGGLGTFHYFVATSLVLVVETSESTAAAAATYIHGVNYLAVLVAALMFFFYRPRVSEPQGELALVQEL